MNEEWYRPAREPDDSGVNRPQWAYLRPGAFEQKHTA